MIEIFPVIREFDSLPDDAFLRIQERFRELARQESFSASEKKSLTEACFGRYVMILPVGHINHYLRENGIVPTENIAIELTDHLDRTLPDTFDEEITVPLLPGLVVPISDRKRALVIGNTPEITDERAAARQTVESFFGKSGDDKWPKPLSSTGYEIAKTSHAHSDDVIDLAKTALSEVAHLLPDTVVYQPAIIDTTPAS